MLIFSLRGSNSESIWLFNVYLQLSVQKLQEILWLKCQIGLRIKIVFHSQVPFVNLIRYEKHLRMMANLTLQRILSSSFAFDVSVSCYFRENQLLDAWQGCQQYYYRCISRKAQLTSALASPSKVNDPLHKKTICTGENKDANQLCSNCTADQHLCFHYKDSIIRLLLKTKISSF